MCLVFIFCRATSSTSDAFTAFIPATGVMYFSVLVMFSCLAGVLLARTSLDLARHRCCADKKRYGPGPGLL